MSKPDLRLLSMKAARLAQRRRFAAKGPWHIKQTSISDRLEIIKDAFRYLWGAFERGLGKLTITTLVDKDFKDLGDIKTAQYILACGGLEHRDWNIIEYCLLRVEHLEAENKKLRQALEAKDQGL
ncbi:MAG: hypothetical protein PVG60_08505 [Desulfarculaceae bacterium]|jgi:hypothetical protein